MALLKQNSKCPCILNHTSLSVPAGTNTEYTVFILMDTHNNSFKSFLISDLDEYGSSRIKKYPLCLQRSTSVSLITCFTNDCRYLRPVQNLQIGPWIATRNEIYSRQSIFLFLSSYVDYNIIYCFFRYW